jgi:hypothetical protein
VLFLGACLAAGCDAGPYDVEISLEKSDTGLRDRMGAVRSIEVNLVGVNDTEKRRWEEMSMNDYWEPDNAIRAAAKKHVMTFGQGHDDTQVLSTKNPIWREWIKDRGASHLFILAYLPWIRKDMTGQADPRRVILPLKRERWEWSAWGDIKIPIKIGSGGMTCLRQPKPEK